MFRGDRLRELRNEKDITQVDLGKLIKVAGPTINRYENGQREPDSDKLDVLAKYFNVTSDYLLGRIDDKNLFVKENLDLICGEMSFEELSVDIGNKLNDSFYSNTFNAEYLKGISEGTIIPAPSRLSTLASYAQVLDEFFYSNNNTIDDLAAAQKEYKKFKKLIDNDPKPCDTLTHFDDDLYSFISDKYNLKYIEFAKKLKEKGINPDDIISYSLKA
jgi:transcriptional regulator with XRE-family HTH domain